MFVPGQLGQVVGRRVVAVRAVVERGVGVADDGADAVARPATTTTYEPGTGAPVTEFTACAPWVWPETRFSAPGVDGPNVVS